MLKSSHTPNQRNSRSLRPQHEEQQRAQARQQANQTVDVRLRLCPEKLVVRRMSLPFADEAGITQLHRLKQILQAAPAPTESTTRGWRL